jgi:hypothetical protein
VSKEHPVDSSLSTLIELDAVLFLDETFSSTAAGPMEVFRNAGRLWNYLIGTPQVPHFRVTTASVDGRAVRCEGGILVQPDKAITSISNLAYEHVAELLAERGVEVDPSCIWRWVQAYAPELDQRNLEVFLFTIFDPRI